MQKFFAIALSCLLLSSATAQDWEAHRQSVLTQPTLIRYHLFDGSPTSPNLAPSKDVPNSDLAYQTQHPIEAVREPGTMSPAPSQAVRIDAGWFEGPKLALDKNFCVEMRVRLLAAGTEKGNDNSDNGTLFGLGNGYDNGIRLTTDCPRQTLVFSIGRPEEAKSRNVAGNQPAPYGIWTHIAAAWDGETMRIYVDGMLYAITDFDGKLTEPGWGFRVGFNDAGVGSVKMDIAEVAVYKDALPPEDIFGHALLMPKLPALPARAYHAIIDAIYRKDFIEAMRRVDQLRMVDLQLDGQQRLEYDLAFRKFRADLAAMSGQLSQSLRLSATLLNDPHLPPHVADGLMQRLIPTEYTNPLAVASSSVYKKMKDDPTFNLTERQRFAVEKCYAQALFVEGKTAEAKELLAKLSERERTYNSESLAKQNLSGEFTDLYKKYREDDKPVVPTKLRDVQPTPPPQFSSDQWLFYVAPDGKADNPGTQAEPFGSLIQARDAIRKLKIDKISTSPRRCDVLVLVRSGVYPVTETFVLEAQDSGADTISICYTAGWERTTDGIKMGTPIFTGGVSVSDFQKVDDPKILNRLPKESQGKVVVATISGDVKFPPAAPRGYGKNGLGAAPAVELFIDDQPMQISRYPNAPNPTAENMLKASENSFVTTGKVHRGFFNTNDENVPGIFEYADQRHERWTEAKDAMLYGYWGHLWAPSSTLIEKIDPQTKQVIMATNVACGTRKDMPYYAFNLLEEIDEPGEWYLDRENNKLYVYPPDGTNINSAKVRLSWFPREFIVAKDVSHVTLHGLHFEEGSGNAIRVEGGKNFSIVGCTAKRFGNWGLGLSGKNHSVVSCDFVTLGGGGINLNGGDVRTLTPGNCLVENTMVNDFSRVDRCYAPAVSMNGVGNRLAHNLFCDSPGHAIRVEGMDHLIEFNEIHSIVYESDDQSGIDIWGNPFIRGMVFRYNYWHHIGSGRDVAGQSGIRLDDMISSVKMYGNVFFRASGGQFGGIQIHGGKDNIVDGNLMIDCKYAVSFSPWGQQRWLEMLDKDFGPRSRREGFNPDSEIFKTKYPDFAELKLNADRNFITRNAAIGCDVFANNGQRNVMSENVMLPWMPSLFTETKEMPSGGENRVPSDARKIRGRLSIPEDSPIYKLLGIAPLPVDQMGLYKDDVRKVIPQPAVTPFFVLE